MVQNNLVKKITMVVIGNLFIGIAVALLRITEFGTDPFTTLNLGISSVLPISFGLYQLLFNIVLLGFVFLYYKSSIGLGTLINMVGIGFISDFLVFCYQSLFDDMPILAIRIVLILLAVVLASLGVALYITPNLGMAPYDALGFVVEKISHQKISFPVARVSLDIISVAIGFTFGATVGFATIILAFCTGPFVQFFRKTIAQPMLNKSSHIPSHKKKLA
ncbi:YitT family protein [Gracilibacillus marinus]|uniref:YitT family protein n=1 Tax=Gracilibacillus marinus TaxID=630535 RepID=A0ABV8VPN5_9BACI